MARPATGQIIVKRGKTDTTFAARFRAYGCREYVTLGRASEGMTRTAAEDELAGVLVDVRRGVWRPPTPEPLVERDQDPTFHEFASEWIAAREQEGLGVRTLEDYRWALSYHLLPFFKSHRLTEITVREVDRYKTTKASEGTLSNNSINKTLTRLSQILAVAVEYELIPANPAMGRRRRLKSTKPRRPWVEPEQLPTLLSAAENYLHGRGRPLMATLAGAGLRISEALALERRDVNLARGTLVVRDAKTEAGERTVDLTPALREELTTYLLGRGDVAPNTLLFPTANGTRDNRNNVRRRLFVPAVSRANAKLREMSIEAIPDNLSPHGLRRTYASLRCYAGDDPAHTSAQLGHEDARFTLSVYTHAVKRKHRLTASELVEFNRAIEWAQWARMDTNGVPEPQPLSNLETEVRA